MGILHAGVGGKIGGIGKLRQKKLGGMFSGFVIYHRNGVPNRGEGAKLKWRIKIVIIEA